MKGIGFRGIITLRAKILALLITAFVLGTGIEASASEAVPASTENEALIDVPSSSGTEASINVPASSDAEASFNVPVSFDVKENIRSLINGALEQIVSIPDDAPWLVRVNQTTNTVTVYRVLDEWEQEIYIPVYACPCSVGESGKTPNGTYTILDHLRWHELVGPTWGQWCSHFARAFLFHSLPYEKRNDPNSLQPDVYNQIGTAASHGCVRLTAVDAKYIFDNLPVGSKVEIFNGTVYDDPLGKPERPYIGEWEETYDPTDPEFDPVASTVVAQ